MSDHELVVAAMADHECIVALTADHSKMLTAGGFPCSNKVPSAGVTVIVPD